jgi:hypothetical protein
VLSCGVLDVDIVAGALGTFIVRICGALGIGIVRICGAAACGTLRT